MLFMLDNIVGSLRLRYFINTICCCTRFATGISSNKSLFAFLLAAASASAFSDGGSHLPFTLLPADPAAADPWASDCPAMPSWASVTTAAPLYASGGYISYGALRRDRVPCSRRGARRDGDRGRVRVLDGGERGRGSGEPAAARDEAAFGMLKDVEMASGAGLLVHGARRRPVPTCRATVFVAEEEAAAGRYI
ncbi:hypothetical protein SETIT_7G249000v2 [Setaria italica]|uniref:Uncharacterized protein n=1 Tax=Setaria italica TaxID=4555 RepID=A0A368RZE3_SETIT|nr:hypothetical protein SETIT_7G249000v2 [Setaria italica]